jgi:hypothetical protein
MISTRSFLFRLAPRTRHLARPATGRNAWNVVGYHNSNFRGDHTPCGAGPAARREVSGAGNARAFLFVGH